MDILISRFVTYTHYILFRLLPIYTVVTLYQYDLSRLHIYMKKKTNQSFSWIASWKSDSTCYIH